MARYDRVLGRQKGDIKIDWKRMDEIWGYGSSGWGRVFVNRGQEKRHDNQRWWECLPQINWGLFIQDGWCAGCPSDRCAWLKVRWIDCSCDKSKEFRAQQNHSSTDSEPLQRKHCALQDSKICKIRDRVPVDSVWKGAKIHHETTVLRINQER